MSDNPVLLDIKDSVATVTLNRPESHNAFDESVVSHLTGIFEDIALLDDVRAIVLRAKGKSFSAGGDLNWMKRAAGYTDAQNVEDAMKLATMLHRLYTVPKVTIACVYGAVMGGGMGLVSCCDIVVAEKESVFALSEVKLGLIPATIGPYVIRAVGERQFRRFAQTGERFNGQKALEIGLVHELAQRPEDVDYLLHAVLKNIDANGPQAMREAKKLAVDLAGKLLDDSLIRDTARRIAQIRATPEAREGINAFLEKRKAAWIRE